MLLQILSLISFCLSVLAMHWFVMNITLLLSRAKDNTHGQIICLRICDASQLQLLIMYINKLAASNEFGLDFNKTSHYP